MTSRVQKGGPVFRPVKSRSRTDTPQRSESWKSSSPYIPPPSSWPLDPSLALSSPAGSVIFNQTISHEVPTFGPTFDNPSTPQRNHVVSARSTPAPPTLISHSSSTSTPLNMPISIAGTSDTTVYLQASHNGKSNSSSDLHRVGTETVPQSIVTIDPAMQSGNLSFDIDGSNQVIDTPSVPPQPSTPTADKSKGSRKGTSSRNPPSKKGKAQDRSNKGSPEPSRAKRKRRDLSGTPHRHKSRGPSIPPYDPNVDPGEEIDPTVVTMASLCNDTGQGRVSRKAAEILSNHAAWKSQNREKRARMKTLMELKKYGHETHADTMEVDPSSKDKDVSASSEPVSSNAAGGDPTIVDETGSGFDYSQNLATSRFNVQVRIGPNGETIIDEESLVVDRVEGEDTTHYTHVVESDHTKFVNSGSYGKRYRGSRWSAEETERFYSALAQYGENYELIAYVLPGRDRKSCKNKFKAEDRKNPARINYCLNNSIPVDMVTLSRMTGKDFSGPVPEIRAPTSQLTFGPQDPAPEPENQEVVSVERKRTKKTTPDDDAVIIGETDSFVHAPDDR